MKVMLIKDVYKLGRAGDVKRVADGFGRNYLLPQGLAVLATPGTLKQVDHIRAKAATFRAAVNEEMSGVAEQLTGKVFTFASKAGETGKLYGSITNQMIAEEVNQKLGLSIDRHQIEADPIRTLGEHKARVRLTVDLIPKIKIIVHREGEVVEVEAAGEASEEAAVEEPIAEETAQEEPEAPAAEE